MMCKRLNVYISSATCQAKERDSTKPGVESEDYRGVGRRNTRPETRLFDAAARNGTNRKSEPTVVLSQELGSTGVESG